MPKKFISNGELRKLLSQATSDEKLALTKIVAGEEIQVPYGHTKLQTDISLYGGNSIANLFRSSGTGYLDIVSDVSEALEINNRLSYHNTLQFYDEIYYIKGEKGNSSLAKYTRNKATELGSKYIEKYEQKIIIKVMENAYNQMQEEKNTAENNLESFNNKKDILYKDLKVQSKNLLLVVDKMNRKKFIFFNANSSEELVNLNNEQNELESNIKDIKKQINTLESKIQKQEEKLEITKKRVEDFDINLSRTVNQYSTSNAGAIVGTAGLMTLANLGGFATYTFLTSFMSTISFGTLGFGAYTAATSFLSVVIGPVGWAGLGLYTLFRLGKADMNKLVLIVATIGVIRQRIKFNENKE